MEMYCKQSFIGLFPYLLQKFKVCDQNKNTVGLKRKKRWLPKKTGSITVFDALGVFTLKCIM